MLRRDIRDNCGEDSNAVDEDADDDESRVYSIDDGENAPVEKHSKFTLKKD